MDIWQNKKKPKTEAAKDILIQCPPVHLQFSLLLSPWQCLWILSSQEIQVFLPQAQGSVWPASAIHHPLIIYVSWHIPHDVLKNVSVMVWRRACAVSDLYIIWSITSSLCTIHVNIGFAQVSSSYVSLYTLTSFMDTNLYKSSLLIQTFSVHRCPWLNHFTAAHHCHCYYTSVRKVSIQSLTTTYLTIKLNANDTSFTIRRLETEKRKKYQMINQSWLFKKSF